MNILTIGNTLLMYVFFSNVTIFAEMKIAPIYSHMHVFNGSQKYVHWLVEAKSRYQVKYSTS